jgi:hypothetical protein
MIIFLIMSEMINTIKVCFVGKLQKVLVNLTQILTHNPLQVDLNTHVFYCFFQIGIHLGKWNKCPYVDGKLF